MSFLTILLLLLAGGTTTTTELNPLRLALASAGKPATGKMTPDEQSPAQENNPPIRSKHSQKQTKQEAQTETPTGTVEWEYKTLAWDCDVPNCDHFALYDEAGYANYELDDARAALPFEGKRARVTGVVNMKDSVIHVLSIEAAK
jgi:hypothetical protein